MEKLYEIHAEGRYDLLVLDTPPSRNALDFLDAPQPPAAVHRRARAAGVHDADRLRDADLRPRHLDDVLGPAPDHRRRPARGPGRVLPGVQRHGRRLPRARPRVNELLCGPGDLVPGRLRARRASRSPRPSTSTASSIEARAAVRRRDREQGPLRRPPRRRRAGRRRARASCSATRSSPTGSRPTSTTSARSPSATAATSSASRAELGTGAVIEVPYLDRRRPRPRRADRAQPLPVRLRRRGTRRDRGRGLSPERPKPPGVRPGGSTCSSWGDRRKSWVTAARRRRDGCGRR